MTPKASTPLYKDSLWEHKHPVISGEMTGVWLTYQAAELYPRKNQEHFPFPWHHLQQEVPLEEHRDSGSSRASIIAVCQAWH